MNNNDNMQQMSERAEQLINAVTDSIMSTMEVAAERVQLAAETARIKQRMEAFSSVLQTISAQKEAVMRLAADTQDKSTQALYQTQIQMLTAQERAVLERAGVPQTVAQTAIDDTDKLYRRNGRKFESIAG